MKEIMVTGGAGYMGSHTAKALALAGYEPTTDPLGRGKRMATVAGMTGAQFDALPYESARKWELLNGELIPVSCPTPRHQDIVLAIQIGLRSFFAKSKLQAISYQDVEFAMSADDRVRPDLAVLLGYKAGLDRDRIPIRGVPDLAIEVISPSERTAESNAKMRDYLAHGAAEVWQVYPKTQTVEIHRPESDRTVSGGAIVTDLLPGFTLPLDDVFSQGE